MRKKLLSPPVMAVCGLAIEVYKRQNWYGAIAGMVSGGAMVFIWKLLVKPLGGVFGIYELLPAFIISCIMIVAVSLATGKPSKEIEAEFDSVAK